jgi:HEAT repeat protein
VTPHVAPGLGVAAEDLQGLVDALHRPDANDRWAALAGLANLRDPAAAPVVIDVLQNAGEEDEVRQTAPAQEAAIGLKHTASQGLLHLGGLALPALASAVRGPDPNLRAEACATLCHAHAWSEEALEFVSPLVTDPDPDVRLTLVTHIDQLSHDRGRELLKTALGDADPRVSAAARETLDRLESYSA